jgi:gas vesicle protein
LNLKSLLLKFNLAFARLLKDRRVTMNTKKLLYGLGMLATGIGIGAVTALLYAPKSGKETRKLISRKAEDGMDFVSEQSREIRRQAEEAFEKGKEFATRFVA